MSLKVAISAGEVSGDQHLARVVRALKCLDPASDVRGMGGRDCREAGAEIVVDCYRSGGAMGFGELITSATKIFSSFKRMSALLSAWRPDVLLLVDYPDFNLRLARVAHRLGIRVLYYIPPKVWAWRSSRVKKIRRYVDQVATIFPFENDFYRSNGYESVAFVGHPLTEVAPRKEVSESRSDIILLLPGSRRFEVERLLIPMLRAYDILRRRHLSLRAQVVLAPNVEVDWVRSLLSGSVDNELINSVEWVQGDALPAMRRARVGVLKSGTCNLEGAITGLPFVSVYSGTLLAKIIVSLLVPLKEYSPVNIIKAHTVRELMRPRLSENDVVRCVEEILEEGSERDRIVGDLAEVRERLFGADESNGMSGEATVSARVASLVYKLASQKISREGE